MAEITVRNGDVNLHVRIEGPADSPHLPILCVHG